MDNRRRSGSFFKAGATNESERVSSAETSPLSMKYLGHINPLINHADQQSALLTIMHEDNIGKCFPAGENYITTSEDGIQQHYHFTCDFALGVERKDFYAKTAVYVVDTQPQHIIGSGISGTVYPVVGAIKYRFTDAPGLRFEADDDKSVVKVAVDSQVNNVGIEYDNASQLPHLRARRPLLGSTDKNIPISWLQMRRLRGKCLLDIITDDLSVSPDSRKLTVDDRMQLSVALFKALHEQIHRKKLIHSDIKLENILAYHDEHGWHVNIIDVGHSASTESVRKRVISAATFMDAASLEGHLDQSRDVFAMSLVIGILWRDINQLNLMSIMHGVEFNQLVQAVQSYRSVNNWNITFDMFNGIDGLSDKLKSEITDILAHGTEHNIEQRYDALACFDAFETVYYRYRRERDALNEAQHHALDAGFNAALKARAILNQPGFLSQCLDTETRDQALKALADVIAALPEHNHLAVNEFTHALGISALHDIHDKHLLIEKIKYLFDKYISRYGKIQNIYHELFSIFCEMENTVDMDNPVHLKHLSEFSNYLNQLSGYCSNVIEQEISSLDILAKQAERLHEKYLKVKSAKNHFMRVLSDISSHTPPSDRNNHDYK